MNTESNIYANQFKSYQTQADDISNSMLFMVSGDTECAEPTREVGWITVKDTFTGMKF
jgi:hypothetical protein